MARILSVFPKLYATSSKGKIKSWEVSVVEDVHGIIFVRKSHGYLGKKIQTQDKEVKSGKNIGRANETTIVEQAVFNAQSSFNKKCDENYIETIPDENTVKILLPMLAKDYKKQSHNIVFPCYVQPKMNGVRCLGQPNGKASDALFTSRRGKAWTTLGHLVDDVKTLPFIVDGEVFNKHMDFQDIVRASKKTNDNTPRLQLWVYDVITDNADHTFEERLDLLRDCIPDEHPHLVKVPTYLINNNQDLEHYYGQFIAEGYEGLIVRNMSGTYKKGHRSSDLQKYKPVKDAEFEIVGGHMGEGTMEGCCVHECKTINGTVFSVMPKGTKERRREYWATLPEDIGKMLTIEFEDYSQDGVPLKPIGIEVRDYE